MAQVVVQDSTAGLRKWTKRILISIFVVPIAFFVLLILSTKWITRNLTPEQKQEANRQGEFRRSSEFVPQALQFTLFDASSARFTGQYMGHAADGKPDGKVVCGMVNAKNRLGAYTGFRRFVVSFSDMIAEIEPPEFQNGSAAAANFNASWSTHC
jgi:hypothetical protein